MTDFIRPLMPGDLPALIAVIDATGLFPGAMLNDMAAAYLARADADELWCVFDDGAVAGLAYAAPERMTDGTWNLLLIAADPHRQRTGIGSALIAAVERQLGARGVRLLLVETSGLTEFDATRRFYRQRGYREEARIRDFYQAGEDKIVFVKPLPD